jgi:hypothetical protein
MPPQNVRIGHTSFRATLLEANNLIASYNRGKPGSLVAFKGFPLRENHHLEPALADSEAAKDVNNRMLLQLKITPTTVTREVTREVAAFIALFEYLSLQCGTGLMYTLQPLMPWNELVRLIQQGTIPGRKGLPPVDMWDKIYQEVERDRARFIECTLQSMLLKALKHAVEVNLTNAEVLMVQPDDFVAHFDEFVLGNMHTLAPEHLNADKRCHYLVAVLKLLGEVWVHDLHMIDTYNGIVHLLGSVPSDILKRFSSSLDRAINQKMPALITDVKKLVNDIAFTQLVEKNVEKLFPALTGDRRAGAKRVSTDGVPSSKRTKGAGKGPLTGAGKGSLTGAGKGPWTGPIVISDDEGSVPGDAGAGPASGPVLDDPQQVIEKLKNELRHSIGEYEILHALLATLKKENTKTDALASNTIETLEKTVDAIDNRVSELLENITSLEAEKAILRENTKSITTFYENARRNIIRMERNESELRRNFAGEKNSLLKQVEDITKNMEELDAYAKRMEGQKAECEQRLAACEQEQTERMLLLLYKHDEELAEQKAELMAKHEKELAEQKAALMAEHEKELAEKLAELQVQNRDVMLASQAVGLPVGDVSAYDPYPLNFDDVMEGLLNDDGQQPEGDLPGEGGPPAGGDLPFFGSEEHMLLGSPPGAGSP